ncbi:MAG TPA: hypothetical protein DCM08_09225 [Microscillaceae bacterium]|nr:hypothetical protein [Microscillaceae bacterium]
MNTPETHLFETNIHCGNCLKSVSPFLNQQPSIEEWSVDLASEQKLLKVVGEVTPQDVEKWITEAGFQAKSVEKNT